MREAVVEAKVSLQKMREALTRTEREASGERRQLEDAERRAGLAEGIGDVETVTVAKQFAGKHAERLGVLERKAVVLRDEILLVEREIEEMLAQLARAQGGVTPPPEGTSRPERGRTPGIAAELEAELQAGELERAEREARIQAQLEALKKKMGG